MAPDRGDTSSCTGEHEQSKEEAGSRLPFVLVFAILFFIVADRLGLLGNTSLRLELEPSGVVASPCSTVTAALAVSTFSLQEQDITAAADVERVAESHGLPEGEQRRMSEDANPQQNAMLFLFNAILLGSFITQVLHFRWFRGLQQTVVLFLFGVTYSLILEGLELQESFGVFGKSYNMWMDIDPHLLLFTMLPPLLAGDAMTMDTAIARRVATQWLYLAGPGVLINGCLTALFLWTFLPYDWPFLLCLTTGAILCATDPVAVVALLKELGAPPALTVQIQGESLLNDGTAIVLYQLTYNMLQGEQYDASDIIVFFVRTAACAWCVGLVIGWFFYGWIKAASNKLEHHSAVIQISLTLSCAYWSFLVAEGVFHMSGVLATVASSLVLADKMWPLIVCKESMHTVWHMFEYLGNIVVFFLAGALTGKLMVHMPLRDYFYLIVIYVVLMVIRGMMLLCSRPIMNFFAKKKASDVNDNEGMLSVSDCLVMTWGGLRGAVGLALAIQVSVDKAGGEISEMDANRVLFYTGGVAALTLIINATTCPALVKFLRVAQMPATKKRVLSIIYAQLVEKVNKMKATIEHEGLAIEDVEAAVKMIGEWINKQGEKDLERVSVTAAKAFGNGNALRSQVSGLHKTLKTAGSTVSQFVEDAVAASSAVQFAQQAICKLKNKKGSVLYDNNEVLKDLEEARERLSDIPTAENIGMLGDVARMNIGDLEFEEQLADILRKTPSMDPSMVRAMHEVFLNLVNTSYWRFIEAGDVVPGTNEADVLLCSIKLSLGSQERRLHDLRNIQNQLRKHLQTTLRLSGSATSEFHSEEHSRTCGTMIRERIKRMVDSVVFQGFIMFAIMSNAVYIALEDQYQNDTNQEDMRWLAADFIFAGIFLLEFVMKYISYLSAYFKDSWNTVDFVLVVLSLGSIMLNLVAKEVAKHHDVAGESRLVRLARVLRVLRLMRVFRLLTYGRAFMAVVLYRMEFNHTIAERVQVLTIITCFIKAHLGSQQEILSFFGREGKVTMPELARVILESIAETYEALNIVVSHSMELEKAVIQAIDFQKRSKGLAESLDAFVQGASEKGVITAREAEKLLKPVHYHLKTVKSKISEVHLGYLRTDSRLTKATQSAQSRSSSQSIGWMSDAGDADEAVQTTVGTGLSLKSSGESLNTEDGQDILQSNRGYLSTKRPSGAMDVTLNRPSINTSFKPVQSGASEAMTDIAGFLAARDTDALRKTLSCNSHRSRNSLNLGLPMDLTSENIRNNVKRQTSPDHLSPGRNQAYASNGHSNGQSPGTPKSGLQPTLEECSSGHCTTPSVVPVSNEDGLPSKTVSSPSLMTRTMSKLFGR